MKNNRLLIISILLMSGCAYIPQKVDINPNVMINKEDVGQGKKVAVKIIDDREDLAIGNRSGSSNYGMIKGAAITAEQDITEVIKTEVFKGLTDKGFLPVVYVNNSSEEVADNQNVLKVSLRTLKYDTDMGLWTGGNIGKANIKALVSKQEKNYERNTYERSYQGLEEIRTAFVGSQETNAKVINGALKQSLEKLFNDADLMEALTK